jgi:chemotaxis protein methyltransferase CheR
MATYAAPALGSAEFNRLRGLIREKAGIHLGDRKRYLVQSRLAMRLRQLELESFAQYCERLETDAAEADELINCVTTNKTSFFREMHHFEVLHERLLAARPPKIRIWSAGCSTGEEAYSLAMCMREWVPTADTRILASDIDTQVLAHAQAGIYSSASVETLSPERRKRHLLRGHGEREGEVRVRDEVQALVAFRRINFRDPQWPVRCEFDAIFCRNVLIYFDQALQRSVVDRLVSLLKPGGLLCLGHSEGLLGTRPDLVSLSHTAFSRTAGGGA